MIHLVFLNTVVFKVELGGCSKPNFHIKLACGPHAVFLALPACRGIAVIFGHYEKNSMKIPQNKWRNPYGILVGSESTCSDSGSKLNLNKTWNQSSIGKKDVLSSSKPCCHWVDIMSRSWTKTYIRVKSKRRQRTMAEKKKGVPVWANLPYKIQNGQHTILSVRWHFRWCD